MGELRLPYPVNIILADLPDYEWAEVGRYIEELQTTIETLQRRIAELEVKP